MAFLTAGSCIGFCAYNSLPENVSHNITTKTVWKYGMSSEHTSIEISTLGYLVRHGLPILGLLIDLTSGIALVIIGALALAHVISLPSGALAMTITGCVYIPVTLVITSSDGLCNIACLLN